MPVLDAVQTFAGITNENEFYSHHYLAEVFKGDIKDRLEAWEAMEEAQRVKVATADSPLPSVSRPLPREGGREANETQRAPYKRLQAWAQHWFALRGRWQRGQESQARWQDFT